jgi:hypothetical protein
VLALMPVNVLVMAWLQRTSLLVHTKKLSQCSVVKQEPRLLSNSQLIQPDSVLNRAEAY